ncbi:SLC13 family permease [Tabrizicola sp.]|uniref:SLC13 family permease n=1 Tax=Tabrizicola sp. TaxID=2005166 RepID=UPI003F36C818
MAIANTDAHRTLAFGPPPRELFAAVAALFMAWAVWTLPEALSSEGRKALIITTLAVIGWTMTRLPDSLVAIAAALALVFVGSLTEKQLFAAMGSELVWLLIAAFVIAAVIRKSGLMEQIVARALSPFHSFTGVIFALTGMVALTAFFIPSTSGRAALLLPVFIALADQMPDRRLVRPLALLFPTVILLSAGGSLIGAGAHLVAVDAISRAGGPAIGYADWFLLAFPVTMAKCLAAAGLILWLFVPADLRTARLDLARPAQTLDARQFRIGIVLVALVALWATTAVHGVSVAIVALIGALVLLTRPFAAQKTKEVFKGVDSELIVYLAATVLIAEALIDGGADKWLAASALTTIPAGLANNTAFAVAFITAVSLLAHLFITSRSARAAVLIPAVALPVAAFGHDPALIVMVATLGTGFCQTMMASAKPVAIYGTLDRETFQPADLIRLALPLMPVFAGMLIAAALMLWPLQLDRTPKPEAQLTAEVTLPGPTAAELAAVRMAIATYSDRAVMPPMLSDLAPTTSPRPVQRPEALMAEVRSEVEAAEAPRKADKPRKKRGLEAELQKARKEVRSAVRQIRSDLGLW